MANRTNCHVVFAWLIETFDLFSGKIIATIHDVDADMPAQQTQELAEK